MQLHELQRKTKQKSKKLIGRGGRRGKTSGRGHKGQKARAGHSIRPQIRDEIKKLPKQRGYRFNSATQKPAAVNVATLESNFAAGDSITPKTLVEAGVVRRKNGKVPLVKVLGQGDITKKLTVTGCIASKAAEEKIKKAGGTVTA